jgi:hypothetical protein
MNRHRLEGRLVRLEERIAPPACPTCHGHPSRLVGIDPETDEETSESMPESGCPACGQLPWITLCLVGIDANLP